MIYLFDTNIVIDTFRNVPAVMQRVATIRADPNSSYYLSSTIVGELYYGAFHAKRDTQAALAEVDDLLQTTPIFACDAATARYYGQIRQDLTAQGQVIPENDMWIAAVARQHGLTLATRDAHFNRVGGLLLAQW